MLYTEVHNVAFLPGTFLNCLLSAEAKPEMIVAVLKIEVRRYANLLLIRMSHRLTRGSRGVRLRQPNTQHTHNVEERSFRPRIHSLRGDLRARQGPRRAPPPQARGSGRPQGHGQVDSGDEKSRAATEKARSKSAGARRRRGAGGLRAV